MPTLAEIREAQFHYTELIEQLQKSADGELTDEQQEIFQALLDSQEETEEQEQLKIQRIIELIKDWENWAKLRAAEAERIKALATADLNRAKQVRSLLQNHLQQKEVKSFRTLRYNVQICQNGGKRSVKFKDGYSPTDLPKKFQKITTTVDADKDALREYLESGGVLDFAYLEERGYHLRIS